MRVGTPVVVDVGGGGTASGVIDGVVAGRPATQRVRAALATCQRALAYAYTYTRTHTHARVHTRASTDVPRCASASLQTRHRHRDDYRRHCFQRCGCDHYHDATPAFTRNPFLPRTHTHTHIRARATLRNAAVALPAHRHEPHSAMRPCCAATTRSIARSIPSHEPRIARRSVLAHAT